MSLRSPAQIQEHLEVTTVAQMQTAGMPPLSFSSSIWKHLSCRNTATLAHQGAQTTVETQVPSPAWSLEALFPTLVLDLDLNFDHTKLQSQEVRQSSATSARDSPGDDRPVDSGHSMPAKHMCATEGAATSRSQTSSPSCISDAARQTQVHEVGNVIHRLMPPDRIIYFNIDRDSFRLGGVSDSVTGVVVTSAELIASYLQEQGLGINFAHRSSSDPPAVFEIRYDPSLEPKTLAKSFFPSDPRTDWELGISKTVVTSRDNLDFLPNILAHEFSHILGLRHWNARTHEVAVPSFQWPNTERDCQWSVMITNAHPSIMRFSEEDLRVIREMYSYANGDVIAGREIIDVYV